MNGTGRCCFQLTDTSIRPSTHHTLPRDVFALGTRRLHYKVNSEFHSGMLSLSSLHFLSAFTASSIERLVLGISKGVITSFMQLRRSRIASIAACLCPLRSSCNEFVSSMKRSSSSVSSRTYISIPGVLQIAELCDSMSQNYIY